MRSWRRTNDAVAFWQECVLAMPWNDPAADAKSALEGPSFTILELGVLQREPHDRIHLSEITVVEQSRGAPSTEIQRSCFTSGIHEADTDPLALKLLACCQFCPNTLILP